LVSDSKGGTQTGVVGKPEGRRPLARPRRRWVDNIKMNRMICLIYETIILPLVLYGCETWSLTVREEHRLRMFENRVLERKNIIPKRDEVTGEWRKIHNEELHDLYSSPSIIRTIKSRRMRWAGHVARTAEKRNAYRLLVGKPEGRRPLARPRRTWWIILK
jgi:hypothetical protein